MKGRRSNEGYREDLKIPTKCFYDTHDLECPNKFNPPLLSTSTEFCTEALAKGFPIPKCILAKPKKLQIEKEPPPLAKPATSRNLRNWQKWCYIWRQTYNKLTAKRDIEGRPPVMSSGEAHRIKNEDKELFDRTLHAYNLNGFPGSGAHHPITLRGSKEIQVTPNRRNSLDFPEMKRHRYSNYVRNEISVPPRKSKGVKGKFAPARSPPGFNWDETWVKSKHVEKMKDALACDFQLYGKIDPIPENLLFKPTYNQGLSERSVEPRLSRTKSGKIPIIPQLVLSPDTLEKDEKRDSGIHISPSQIISNPWEETRGPILKIRSQFSQLTMTFSGLDNEFPHFIANPAVTFTPGDGETLNDSAFFYDDDHHFSITTKSKETKLIRLKNVGTTVIRYQWFRNPPTYDAQQMLQDPSHYKHIKLETNEENEDLDGDSGRDAYATESNPIKRVVKKIHPEFHFSSLPSVILPGQSSEFPIIFRSKLPGYFHETLYLLTHPRLGSSADGRQYAIRLSGVCCDMELTEKNNELHEMENLKRYLNERSMEEETIDLIDSILDRALFEATTMVEKKPSMTNGRITAESLFSSHNPEFTYHFSTSELAIDLMSQIVEMLVPRDRVAKQAQCDMSLQCFYNLILTARNKRDLHWEHLRSTQCEEMLQKLNTECIQILNEPRMFVWPTTERRKYTACYTSLVGTMDEILLGFDRLYNVHNAPAIKLVDQQKAVALVEDMLRLQREEEELRLLQILSEEDELYESFSEDDDGEGNNASPSSLPALIAGKRKTEVAIVEGDEEEDASTGSGDHHKKTTGQKYATRLSMGKRHQDGIVEDYNEESGGFEPESNASYVEMFSVEDGSGDAHPPATLPNSTGSHRTINTVRASTDASLYDEMHRKVEKDRRQVLRESRVKLFEDILCSGIEKMLVTVDTFNNMLDYKDSDAILVITDKC